MPILFRPALLCLAALGAASAFAQQGVPLQYQQYGDPVDVSITDLLQNGTAYEGRAVRTSGEMEVGDPVRRLYELRDGLGARVRITPVAEIQGVFDEEAMKLSGRAVEVTGVFRLSSPVGSGSYTGSGLISFWDYAGPPEKPGKGATQAKPASLEALVTSPGRRDGQTVRVVGKFRGRNLYGDLPVRSQRDTRDWVIKDDLYAVWITGHKPKGDGWELDAGLKRDTNKWIEVVGRVETRGGVVYIAARELALGKPPSPEARAEAPPPPPERPKLPPVVVFALPLDGESEVPSNAHFAVQFSKDMDEQSFRGNVVLRYVGPVRPGDRGFDGLRLSYDGGRRALVVDPGDLLRPGRQLELLLLPGILDIDGLPLVPRSGKEPEGPIDVLRYRVNPGG